MKNAIFWDVVVLAIIDVLEERTASIIRVERINELRTVTANTVPSSLTLSTLMMELLLQQLLLTLSLTI
jgi:hypothetical protein